MRKALFAIFALVIVFSGYHLSGMSALGASVDARVHAGAMDPDCPMGFVCPMRLGSVDFTAAQPSQTALTVFASFAVAILFLIVAVRRSGYVAPSFIVFNSGPPVILATSKKE